VAEEAGSKSARTRERILDAAAHVLRGNAGLLRSDLEARAARMLVLGALNWAAEWWNPRRGSLEVVVRTAQSLVRNGLAAPQSEAAGSTGGTRVRRRSAQGQATAPAG
jgi:hypothetical protein